MFMDNQDRAHRIPHYLLGNASKNGLSKPIIVVQRYSNEIYFQIFDYN